MSHTHWNRRTFLATAGLTTAAAITPRLLAEPTRAAVACIATANHIQLFQGRGDSVRPIGDPTLCEAPRSPILHPTRAIVYVAHDTSEYLGLPRASISAYSIDRKAGTLTPISRVPLALSATHPQHLAISPDGRTLLVAATGGGVYNIFTLAPNGSVLPAPRVLKQTGCGPHPLQSSAQPSCSVFHPTQPIAYACDFGADRVDQLDLSAATPTILSRTQLTPGSGPALIALDPAAHRLIVTSSLQPTQHVISIDRNSHRLSPFARRVSIDATTCSSHFPCGPNPSSP
jgi:6-phosphogluconolactonase